jgi:hypothetical protein
MNTRILAPLTALAALLTANAGTQATTRRNAQAQKGRSRRAKLEAALARLLEVPSHRRDKKWDADRLALECALYGGRLGRQMARRRLSLWGKCGRTERLAKWKGLSRRERQRRLVERVRTPAEELKRLERRVALHYTTGAKAATRALICAEHGVPNTGRQWRKLRKRIRRDGDDG